MCDVQQIKFELQEDKRITGILYCKQQRNATIYQDLEAGGRNTS